MTTGTAVDLSAFTAILYLSNLGRSHTSRSTVNSCTYFHCYTVMNRKWIDLQLYRVLQLYRQYRITTVPIDRQVPVLSCTVKLQLCGTAVLVLVRRCHFTSRSRHYTVKVPVQLYYDMCNSCMYSGTVGKLQLYLGTVQIDSCYYKQQIYSCTRVVFSANKQYFLKKRAAS